MWRAVLAEDGGRHVEVHEPWELWVPNTAKGVDRRLAELVVPPGARVAAIPGIRCLSNKRSLWVRMVQRWGREAALNYLPASWLPEVPADLAALRADVAAGRGPYLIKDVRRQRREGVTLVHDPLPALQEPGALDRPRVVQRGGRRRRGHRRLPHEPAALGGDPAPWRCVERLAAP